MGLALSFQTGTKREKEEEENREKGSMFTYGTRDIVSSKWGARGFDLSPTLESVLKQSVEFKCTLNWVKPANLIQRLKREMEYSNKNGKKSVEPEIGWRAKLSMGMKINVGASVVIQNVIQDTISANCSPFYGNEQFDLFTYYLWIKIAKCMRARALSMLFCANSWYRRLLNNSEIWESVFLRDTDKPVSRPTSFSWFTIYKAAFDGSHSFSKHQNEQHIEWIRRIGFFYLDHNSVVSTGSQNQNSISLIGNCILKNPRKGIWMADLHWVPCVFCNRKDSKAPSIVLDASHVELFLEEGYENNMWQYQQIYSHIIPDNSDAVIAGIFDARHIFSKSTTEIFTDISWIGPVGNPRGIKRSHAVAVGINLPQPNKGVLLKHEAMRDYKGEVVSIRITLQLI